MGRLVLIAFGLWVPAGAAWAQPAPPPSPWHVNAEPQPVKLLDLSPTDADPLINDGPDSRVVAGTEVLPNGMFGVGMFGEEMEESVHSPATVWEFSLPKQRKPAVGFSLKF